MPQNSTSLAKQLKHALLKVVDITALSFLEPVVRLAFGEEPQAQIKKIGRLIGVPILAIIAFLGLWAFIAPKHTTKSGEVPTPDIVLDAAASTLQFHTREGVKEEDFLRTGESREAALARAQARLAQLDDREVELNTLVAEAEADATARRDAVYQPLADAYDALRTANREASKAREAELKARAADIAPDDTAAKAAFLADFHAHRAQDDAETEELRELRARRDAALATKDPGLDTAQRQLTRVAEETQFLRKRIELLSEDNREVKLAAGETGLEELRASFATAPGDQLFRLAGRMARAESRAESLAGSTYAKPWTLPRQVVRSLACVFVGFFMAAFIAIPIGILCGLSRTFMAAMTPLIALFKPVSPIVWLPIALIVVGGFIDDPDSHWLLVGLSEIPIISALEINPAFIASAITVALCCLWATLVNTALGVSSIDEDYINVSRVLRLGFWSRLFRVVLPSAMPLIFAGLRISLGVGWMVLIAAELLSSSEGIGKFVWDQFQNGSSQTFAQMFVVVFVVGAIGLALDRIMVVCQRLVSFDGSSVAI